MTQTIRRFWDKNATRYDDSERKSEAVNKEIIETEMMFDGISACFVVAEKVPLNPEGVKFE